MTRRLWRRRTILTGAVVVALSVGIVFASIPFLPYTPPPHSSITTTKSYEISGGNQSRPGFSALTVSGISSGQTFWVGVTVTKGAASFCVLSSLSYQDWVSAYDLPGSALDRLTGCILGPTQQVYQDILKFQPPYSGTWAVLALNSNPAGITVDFGPA